MAVKRRLKIRRYEQIAGLLLRFGLFSFVKRMAGKEYIERKIAPEKLRTIIEELGPTAIKFGQ